MSMHETRRPATTSYGRSVSAPRRRLHARKGSQSPARVGVLSWGQEILRKCSILQDIRIGKIMSAVSVLLDELDTDGLRSVIEQAQDRMKKRT